MSAGHVPPARGVDQLGRACEAQGKRWHPPPRYPSRFSDAAPLTRHVTRAHGARFDTLPPGPGLAALLLSNVRAHAAMAAAWQAFAKSDRDRSTAPPRSHYTTLCSTKRVARGLVRASTSPEKEPMLQHIVVWVTSQITVEAAAICHWP